MINKHSPACLKAKNNVEFDEKVDEFRKNVTEGLYTKLFKVGKLHGQLKATQYSLRSKAGTSKAGTPKVSGKKNGGNRTRGAAGRFKTLASPGKPGKNKKNVSQNK